MTALQSFNLVQIFSSPHTAITKHTSRHSSILHVDKSDWNVIPSPQLPTDINSTVPTKDQVLIPESLLKKRKTQEKTQAERDQALAEKKKVCN